MLASFAVVGVAWSSAAFADEHIRGVITGRSAAAVVVQTDTGKLTVALSDTTSVHRIDGIRPVRVSSADLIPGLRIKAAGTFDTPSGFSATKVTFSKADFRTASLIQGGVTPTDERSLVNERNIAQHQQELNAHAQRLGEHGQKLATQEGQIQANDQRIVATAGAVAATNTRIANLDNFNVLKSVTVYFPNGKSTLSKSDKAQLQQFAGEARGVNGYMIQVAAFASDVGPDPLNQKLSMERAAIVTSILQQNGVPLGNVFVPAAMGTTEQVAPNTTAKGQAENRRAVVTLLQNKGLAGK
jgi:outer membrane protein OmpA-like peptidoglycan-associated protein